MKTTPDVKAVPEGVPQSTYSIEMQQINLRAVVDQLPAVPLAT